MLNKKIEWDSAKRVVKDLQAAGKKIVFTNGCFDIIHKGHVELLEHARKLGDYLLVGLNSDTSVRSLKGNERPINPVDARIAVLSAICFVDGIVVFDQTTPYELLSVVQPCILVKGGDYIKQDVIGKEFVSEVVTIPFVAGCSTTKIIDKIRRVL